MFMLKTVLSFSRSLEISDQTVKGFGDEDVFNITLDYNNEDGVCSVVLEGCS